MIIKNEFIIDQQILNELTKIKPKHLIKKFLLNKHIDNTYKETLIQHLIVSNKDIKHKLAKKMENYRHQYCWRYKKLMHEYEEIITTKNDNFIPNKESIYYNQMILKYIKKYNYLRLILTRLGYSYNFNDDIFIIN